MGCEDVAYHEDRTYLLGLFDWVRCTYTLEFGTEEKVGLNPPGRGYQ